MKFLLGAAALALASAVQAAPLTVRVGETWLFDVSDGQPSAARKVAATAKPAKGQIMVSVRALLGTSMIVTNNSPVAYTFNAQLIRGGKAVTARTCTLPAGGRPIFEQWEERADAIRIGNFRQAGSEGRC